MTTGEMSSLLGQDSGDGQRDQSAISLHRPTFTQAQFDRQFHHKPPEQAKTSLKRYFTVGKAKSAFFNFLPFINVMASYDWKRDLYRDLLAGLTVSAMHIPQGMAYGQLASLKPVFGLYVSFFPVLLYFFFGTSRHLSIGTFAVASLMVAKVLDSQVATLTQGRSNSTLMELSVNSSQSSSNFDLEMDLRGDIAISLCLVVGLLQFLLGIVGAGFITKYLSDPFISGYTTGCACQVFTSQMKYIFGLDLPRYTGAFKIYRTWKGIFLSIASTNLVTFSISAVSTVFLLTCKILIDPKVKDYIKMPIPGELIVIVAANLLSFFLNLETTKNVQVVGPIPKNLPIPEVPTIFNWELLVDAVPIVLVSLAVSISMSKMFAKKYSYKINPNQEFIALGLSNAISSFFSCYPAAASISRSAVQGSVGGQSQLASMFACGVILSVLLYLGTLMQPLPQCILSVVVVVNLRSMFLQIYDVQKYWKHYKLDAAKWIVPFLATVLVDVDVGLYIGVFFVLLTVIYQSARVHASVMNQAGGTELFAKASSYLNLSGTPGAVVIKWSCPINFASSDEMINLVNNASATLTEIAENENTGFEVRDETAVDFAPKTKVVVGRLPKGAVILDLAGVAFVDTTGLETLKLLAKDLSSKGVDLLLASCSDWTMTILQSDAEFFHDFLQLNIFQSPIDALVAVQRGDSFANFHDKNAKTNSSS